MSEISHTPSSTPEMLDAAGVASRLKRWVPLGATVAQNWARERRILEVREAGAAAYPACQFDEAGLPYAGLRPVICALSAHMTPEQILDWLYAPCPALHGRAPRNVLKIDPEAVLEAAGVHATAAPVIERRRARPKPEARVSAKDASSLRRSRTGT